MTLVEEEETTDSQTSYLFLQSQIGAKLTQRKSSGTFYAQYQILKKIFLKMPWIEPGTKQIERNWKVIEPGICIKFYNLFLYLYFIMTQVIAPLLLPQSFILFSHGQKSFSGPDDGVMPP